MDELIILSHLNITLLRNLRNAKIKFKQFLNDNNS